MERAKGIEPSYEAWEASVLPLNYARELVIKDGVGRMSIVVVDGRKVEAVGGRDGAAARAVTGLEGGR